MAGGESEIETGPHRGKTQRARLQQDGPEKGQSERSRPQQRQFQGADLGWADLSGADLRGGDLQGARLLFADLTGADLRGASGLTREQVEEAVADATTRLPDDLK